uniref:Uncharacterized protein n=1 Tax=Peronospora matthiolae TaxID=2874970 RepID=A0AAV1TUY3_9STRA
MLAMPGDLSDRMNRTEVARTEQASKDQKGSPVSIFGSALKMGSGMSLQALKHTPPPKKSPNVSPATYFMARRQANVGRRPADHVALDLNMGPCPEPVHHRQEAHAGYIPGWRYSKQDVRPSWITSSGHAGRATSKVGAATPLTARDSTTDLVVGS